MPVAFPQSEHARKLRRYPIWPYHSTPSEWINKKDPNYEQAGSIYQGEEFTLDPTAMAEIKGRPSHIARALRRTMQQEFKDSALKIVKGKDIGTTDETADFFRNLLRGTWWHGRNTVPSKEKLATMAETRRKSTLFGEPVGTSLSKSIEKAEEAFGPELIRVRPVFGTDPLKNVLIHQYEPHAKILNETYVETIKELAEKDPTGTGHRLRQMHGFQDLKGAVDRNTFNDLLTRKLEDKGYRGILYSPVERYNEYELKMFPGHGKGKFGSNYAYFLDKRTAKPNPNNQWGPLLPDPSTVKYDIMFGDKVRKQWRDIAKTGKYHHLKEHYREIDLKKVGEEIEAMLPGDVRGVKSVSPKDALGNMKLTPKQVKLKHLNFNELPMDMQKLADDVMTYANYSFYPGQGVKPGAAGKALKNIVKHTGLEEQSIVETLKHEGGISTLIKDAMYKKPPNIPSAMSHLEAESFIDHHLGNLAKSTEDIVDDMELNESIKIMKALTHESTTALYNAINSPTAGKINELYKIASTTYKTTYQNPLQNQYEAAKTKLKESKNKAATINEVWDSMQTGKEVLDFAPMSESQFESKQKYFLDNAQDNPTKAINWIRKKLDVYNDYYFSKHDNELAAKSALKMLKTSTNLSEKAINNLIQSGDHDMIIKEVENNIISHGIAKIGYSPVLHKDDIGWMTTDAWLKKQEEIKKLYIDNPDTLKNTIKYNLKQYKFYYKGGAKNVTKASNALKAVKAATGLTTNEINHLLNLDAEITIMDYVDLNLGSQFEMKKPGD